MMKTLVLSLTLVLAGPMDARAGPAEDAHFIAQQHMNFGGYAEQLASLETEIFNSLKPAIEKLGAKVVDPQLFMKELTGEFSETYLPDVLRAAAIGFEELLTPQELSDLAQFYRSEAGKRLLGRMPTETPEASEFLSSHGKPLLEHHPKLAARMQVVISQGLSQIKASFSMLRLAEILENPDIIVFADEETRARVAAALRTAE